MRVLNYLVPAELDGAELRKALRVGLALSPAQTAKFKMRPEGIRLNGEGVHVNVPVHEGDMLSVDVSDMGGKNTATPIKYPLEFVYEDEDMAVINKPSGMAVHGAPEIGDCTVANVMAYLWGAETAFHPVNRLDKGTSGLMAVAKSGYFHERLRRILHTDGFCREYLAVVEGEVKPSTGSIELPISQTPIEGTKRICREGGLQSRTDYQVLWAGEGITLVLVRPYTGRTHQIRVHFSSIGHPLMGDRLYGGGDGMKRPALHSFRLSLTQPVTGQRITVTSPLPEDMDTLLKASGFMENLLKYGPF